MSFENLCDEMYNNTYNDEYQRSLNGRSSENAMKSAERSAQKIAIKNTLIQALNIFSPGIEASDLWRAIYVAHLKRKTGVNDLNRLDEHVIQSVISADQSWKKSSGHAFESFIFEVANPLLAQQNIRFVLQTELTRMMQNNEIHNDNFDIEWLNQRIHTDVFDLYAVVSRLNRNYVFGCIQSKTSIRERVTRDREPSRQAMEASFWSIAIALDGTFLAMPKFQEMVNGGGIDYPLNGWHGLYVMSEKYTLDRIYPANRELDLVVQHAQSAAEAWMSARNRFNSNWRARYSR